ncbi:MAG: NAD(P)H-dependent oxidoreductase [Acidimicrobiales bacterium]
MQVLAVNGFESNDETPLVARAVKMLAERGHGVDRLDLAAAGFDAFMTPEERAAYHSDDPLITPEAAAAADLVRSAAGIVIVYPIVHGTGPPRVKSFIERVFVLGVGFEFLPSGRITGALDHVKRACVLGVSDGKPNRARRNDFGPCLARSFYLSSNRSCKTRYVGVTNDKTGAEQIDKQLSSW